MDLVGLGAVVDAERAWDLAVCVARGVAVLEHGLDTGDLEPAAQLVEVFVDHLPLVLRIKASSRLTWAGSST
jgi:hypothetical protein